MHEIKSFNIFQTAKVIGVLYGISFLLVSIIELLVIAVVRQAIMVSHGMAVSPASGPLGGHPPFVFMFVVVPIFGTIFSFIGVAFGCWLYNVLVPHIGGIAFQLNPSAQTNGPSN
jgi:hypothetical protein